MAPEIKIHLPRAMLETVSHNPKQFYRRLERGLQERGYRARLEERRALNLPPEPDDGHFYFIHQATHEQANVLNTGLAYVFPFWYADPKGIYGESSVVDATFEPSDFGDEATTFAARLRDRLAGGRVSRYDQPKEVTRFDGKHVAVFLQGDSDILARSTYLHGRQIMREAVDWADGRPVVIKPHPKGISRHDKRVLDALVARHPNVTVTDANVHDILASAMVTVSISSAVALEGMIHGVPAVLCGKSDLHHCAVTARTREEVAPAIDQTLAHNWPFDAFLYWFLQVQMINAGTEGMIDRVLERMVAQGANLDDFR